MPTLAAGERSGLFQKETDTYGCYLRIAEPPVWAGPWAGIARLEIPASIGRNAAVQAANEASGWLPAFASSPHREARAPVNLTAVAGLEQHLQRRQADRGMALRAVREAVFAANDNAQ